MRCSLLTSIHSPRPSMYLQKRFCECALLTSIHSPRPYIEVPVVIVVLEHVLRLIPAVELPLYSVLVRVPLPCVVITYDRF